VPRLELAPPPSAGFRAQLDHTSLADLIQLECVGGAQGAFEVVSRGHCGHLFFEGGRLVHAVAPGLRGREAALTILSWQEGTFRHVAGTAPATHSIEEGWQSLLMSAACRDDELRRSQPPGVSVDDVEYLDDEVVVLEEESSSPQLAARSQAERENSGLMMLPKERRAVQSLKLTVAGELIEGPAEHRELAEVLSFAVELVSLLGDGLALEPLRSAELTGPGGTILLGGDGESLQVTILAPEEDAASHRARFGL
jgi:hypothetical protein